MARQAGAVEKRRPDRLPDAVVAFPPPLFVIVGFLHFHLAHGHLTGGKRRRHVAGTVPAVAEPPLGPDSGIVQAAHNRFQPGGGLPLRQTGDLVIREHAVIDAVFIVIAAPHEVAFAPHIGRSDAPRSGSPLVDPGRENAGGVLFGHQLAVQIEPHAFRSRPMPGRYGTISSHRRASSMYSAPGPAPCSRRSQRRRCPPRRYSRCASSCTGYRSRR